MPRTLPAFLLAGAVLLAGAMPRTVAQDVPCPPPAALISIGLPAYTDAMDLAKTLEAHGLVVRCIFETKISSQFLVWENGTARMPLEGEACLRTNYGDIDAFFVPKPQTFADLKITERRRGGGHLYTFSGMPGVWTMKQWGSARRDYFFKRGNYLLTVSDEALRARLEDALHIPGINDTH